MHWVTNVSQCKPIDAIHAVIIDRPELLEYCGGFITPRNDELYSFVFAQVPYDNDGNLMWGTICINRGAMRSLEAFEAEYAQTVAEGTFVSGPTARGVFHHELGHLFQHVHGIEARPIIKELASSSGVKPEEYLVKNLSGLSAKGHTLGEAIPEAFAGHYGETGNDAAEAIVRRCGIQ